MCLGEKFFASGQAYVALNRVRTLSDLVLWQFHPSAIYVEPFYQQLLQWCDNVDVIRPTPPTDMVEHPERSHDYLSNAPMPEPSDNSDEPKSGSIQFNFDPSSVGTDCTGKRGRGRPRKSEKPAPSSKGALNTSGPKPKHGRRRPQEPDAPSTSQPKTPIKRSRDCPRKSEAAGNQSITPAKRGRGRPPKSQGNGTRLALTPSNSGTGSTQIGTKRANSEGSDGLPRSKLPKLNTPSDPSINSTINSSCAQFQRTVHTLLGGTAPLSILSAMLSLNSVTNIIVALNGMGEAIEAIVQALNALPTTFATDCYVSGRGQRDDLYQICYNSTVGAHSVHLTLFDTFWIIFPT